MTTPDDRPIPDASEADVAEQQIPVGDADEESWGDGAPLAGADRNWQADEADLIEQSIVVPDDDAEFDR